ncbi:type IV pilus biogenesis protein PilM [Diplocloster hominis]|uniref:type IV pilus biogenesis protein PilM n=1 Tax=Diplocloster hominis TaxID=3079010 RepID=UPI0031BA795F
MNTSIYLSNQNIQILTGSGGRSKVSVKNVFQAKAPEGSLINGVITSEAELAECLGRLWSQYRLPRTNVGLVIDSTKFVTKILTLPAVKGNKLQELVKREFSDLGDREKLLFDYMILNKDSKGRMLKILAAAAERDFIGSYVQLFEKLKISISSVNVALAAELKILDIHPALRGRTCILELLDGDNLVNTLIVNGEYKYSSRSRLFQEHGTEGFALDIARNVSGILQFHASERSEYAITDVFLGGFSKENEMLCVDSIRSLNANLQTALFPDTPAVAMPPAAHDPAGPDGQNGAAALRDCIYAAGNFVVR